MRLPNREGVAVRCPPEAPILPTSAMTNGRSSSPSFPQPNLADVPELTKHVRYSTPSSTCSGADVLGACSRTTSPCHGRRPTTTSGLGAWMGPGSRYTPLYGRGYAACLVESLPPARRSSTPRGLRPPRREAHEATTVARKSAVESDIY